MNSKLIKASLAGVAAIAVAAGGTTFAAWSDFGEISGSAEAGALTLSLTNNDGTAVTPWTTPVGGLAPGENKIQDFYIANRSDDTVALQDAALTLTLTDLLGAEDGCTSNSESVEDTDGCTASAPLVDDGEFTEQAGVQFSIKPAPSATSCGAGSGYASSVTRQGTLDALEGDVLPLGTLDPNQGICVRMELGLKDMTMGNDGIDFGPVPTADNAVQGDSASFTLRFDLAQTVNS